MRQDINLEEINIDSIEWQAMEYEHKEHSNDFLWGVGLIALVGFGLAVWTGNYVFAIFIMIAGATLILFSIRKPGEIKCSIEKKGMSLGRDVFPWEKIKSFNISKGENDSKLFIEIDKYFLPTYTIVIPNEKIGVIKENLLKIIDQNKNLKDSRSMMFMDKIGF